MTIKEFNTRNDTILKAATYIPIGEKTKIVSAAAAAIIGQDEKTGMWRENSFVKEIYLCKVLFADYFGIEFGATINDKDYDYIMSNRFPNRIEALKFIKEDADSTSDARRVKQHIRAILDDYSLLVKLLNKEIHSRIEVLNNPADRLYERMMHDTSPDTMQAALDEMKGLMAQAEDIKKGD